MDAIGTIKPKVVKWRDNARETDYDADDEALPQTPPDVIAALGFDPLNEPVPKTSQEILKEILDKRK